MSSSKCTVETKLSDEKCLVVQFINERQKPVQVGFQAWLKERNTKSNLHHLLDSEVIIRWPIKEDIKCARMMEKILKKKDIIWEDLVVRVRSVGTFIDMCQHVKNIELFGVPNPSREERRKLCKKPSCSEPEDLDSSDLDSSVQNNNTITSAKVDKPPPPKKQKTKALTVKKNNALLQSQIENLSRDFIKKTSQIDLIDDIEEEEEEEEEENDEDSSMFKWSKDRLVDLISTLKVENKKLREDNARLRALRAISEDLHKMTVMSSTLCKDMAKLRRDMDSVLIKDGRSSRNSNNSSDKNSNNNSKPSHSNRNLQKDNNNISNKANNTVDAIERHSEVHADRSTITEADAYEPQLHHNQSLEQQLLPTIAHTEEQLLPTIAHTEEQLLPTIAHTEEQLLPTIAHTEEQLLPTIAHTEQPVQLQNERPAKASSIMLILYK
ncbi:uncharacterized protein [Temnothorax nylanderi]|uniref:uncharacterized protein n=1 Tax=Temnothorax nylanderi TaxID=102681 RepID=UPI003A897D67